MAAVSPSLDELAEIYRTEPTRAEWVIVPSHALGRTLGERLVLLGDSGTAGPPIPVPRPPLRGA